MLGKEFANLMRDLLPGSQRQTFAAAGQATGGTDLQTLALGQQISLITSRAPQPDTPSLVAFARMQGLDDAAVQALFGPLPDRAPAITLEESRQPDRPASPDGPEAKMPLVGPGGLTALVTTDPWMAALATGGVAPTQALPPSWPASHTAQGFLQQAPMAPAAPSGATQQPLIAAASHDLPLPEEPVIEALKATLQASGVRITSMQIPEMALRSAPIAASEAPLPEPDPHDVVFMRLMPGWESITRNLAKAAGQNVSLPWASVVGGWVQLQKGVSTRELDLQLSLTTEQGTSATALDAPLAAFGPNGSHTVQAAGATSSLGATGAPGPATDRSAEIRQLADQLGQALSERLQEQVARGDWKLELHLKPAHLGKISVELGMNGGSLDALFKSDNALTRELITQCAPRLRDSLTQAGMAVANVWVNSDGQQQTGGNPTPRFYRSEVSEVTAPAEDPKGTSTRIERIKSKDGWDELA